MIDAYKIGVSIAMSTNASAVLGVIQRDLFGLHKSVDLVTGKLNAMKVAAVGAMSAIAGAAALRGMWALSEAASDLVHQQYLMRAAGMDNQKVAEATAAAWKVAGSVMGSTAAENAKSIRELRMVFGDTREAITNLEPVTKAQVVMNSLVGKNTGDQVFDMAKALEIKGAAQDPAHFLALLDAMVKAAVASGGRVVGSDFLSAFKYGRAATQGWSDEFVGQILPTLIQEMKARGGFGGATGPGNALMSAYQEVVGGTMSNKEAQEFARLHLVDPSKVIRTSTGTVKGVKPGGIIGSDEFQANPYAWVQGVLMPALKAAGITDPKAVKEEIAHLFTGRTGQQIMAMFALQASRFVKDAELIRQSQGLSAYDTLNGTQTVSDGRRDRDSYGPAQTEKTGGDPVTRMNAFHTAWTNLMTALGSPEVESAMTGIGNLTDRLNAMAQWAVGHPKLVGEIEKITAVFSGLAVVLGGAAMVAAIAAASPLVGSAGLLAGLAAGIVGIADAFQILDKKLRSWFPWAFPDASRGGKSFADAAKSYPVQMPWWAPLPVPTGGTREPLPDWLHFPQVSAGQSVFPGGASYAPPSAANANDPDRVQKVEVVNGRTIADGVAAHQTRQATRPPAGTTGPNVNLGPIYSGQGIP